MTPIDDAAYFRLRLHQERARAEAAHHVEARRAHEHLAALYAARLTMADATDFPSHALA